MLAIETQNPAPVLPEPLTKRANPFDVAALCWQSAEELPNDVVLDLEDYLNKRELHSSFLRCVLENHLSGAINQMPPGMTLEQLVVLLDFLSNHCPHEAWRSVSKVSAYLGGGTR